VQVNGKFTSDQSLIYNVSALQDWCNVDVLEMCALFFVFAQSRVWWVSWSFTSE